MPTGQPKKERDIRFETYFVGAKMKKRKVPLVEGQPVDDFIRQNADDIFRVQAGHFEILRERETGNSQANQRPEGTPGNCRFLRNCLVPGVLHP